MKRICDFFQRALKFQSRQGKAHTIFKCGEKLSKEADNVIRHFGLAMREGGTYLLVQLLKPGTQFGKQRKSKRL